MKKLTEAVHTFAEISFAHYCAEAAKTKREKYFKENFGEAEIATHNGCIGECQGTGWIPVYKDEMTPAERSLWVQAEMDSRSEDGWHMVPCPACSPVEALDEHIVKRGNEYELKSKKSGKNLGTYGSKKGAEKREGQVEYFKHLKEDTDSDKKDDEDSVPTTDSKQSPEDKKEASKKKREAKAKKREQEKLLPYEFDNQKDAEKAGTHLSINGTHLSGGNIYRPGSSEQSLRNAVAIKKQKQKMKSGKITEDSEGNIAIGFTDLPDVIRRIKESVR